MISTCYERTVLNEVNTRQQKHFNLSDQIIEEMVDLFKGESKYVIEFGQSQPISTYVYSLVAGPFEEFKTTEDRYLPIPLRIFCRKSLAKHMKSQ